MSTFEPWPKIPRWNRSVVITEKIDGTNGAIIIEPASIDTAYDTNLLRKIEGYHVYAQSRTRLVRPGVGREAGNDNYGFAAWVRERAAELVELLGPGRHFGEFYGQGIARKYGLDHKRFALFNTKRWGIGTEDGVRLWDTQRTTGLEVDVVPTMSVIDNPDDVAIEDSLEWLRENGSALVPGFDKPEGIVLYHTAAGQTFKILLEGDELPKGIVPRAERELEAARAA